MALTVQQLRTTIATQVPTGLEPGQIALNLANGWFIVGDGGNGVSVAGAPVAAGAATVFGVAGVTIPAVAAGKGYEIYELKNPPASVRIFSATGAQLDGVGAGTLPSRITNFLVAGSTGPAAQIKVAGDLRSGDTAIISAGTVTSAAGSYVWDGSSWILTGAATPDATPRSPAGTGGTKGVVYLARNTDVQAGGSAGATVPDGLAVATGAQVKALATLVASLQTGSTLLGTYDASSAGGKIASANTVAGRTGFTVNGKINAGTGMQEGDYFLVTKPGTVTGDAAPLNVALNANDHLVYDGSAWHVVASGVVASASFTVHAASDVSDAAVAAVASGSQKGVLVRDATVNDGLADAYKLVDKLDLGTF